MSRPVRDIALIGAVLLLLAGAWWWQAGRAGTDERVLVAGSVRPDTRVVSAPAIAYPAPDYAVGIPKDAGSSADGGTRKGAGAAPRTGQPVVAGMLERVLVREGDRVAAGDLVAEFDSAMLDLGVEQAQADEVKARKDVTVLGEKLDDLDDARDDLSTARVNLATAQRTLNSAKSALLKARKQLLAQQKKLRGVRAQRPQLEAALAALNAQAATFPPGQVPAALQKQIAELTGLLASIDPGLAGIARGLRKVRSNLARVERGLAALPGARARIASAEERLDDAEEQLRGAKDVLGVVADGQAVAVRLAKVRRSQAAVRSPLDGVVTFARRGGTVAMVGAPLVRVRADGPQRIDTYLTAEQVAQVAVGSPAEITFDSARGTVLSGHVREIGSAYVFPPTSFPTRIVHMTRTLKVTVELDEGASAPPGTPVDISIRAGTSR